MNKLVVGISVPIWSKAEPKSFYFDIDHPELGTVNLSPSWNVPKDDAGKRLVEVFHCYLEDMLNDLSHWTDEDLKDELERRGQERLQADE